MRKIAVGVILVAAALAIGSIAATMFGTSQASNDRTDELAQASPELSVDDGRPPIEATPLLKGSTQTEGDEDGEDSDIDVSETKPYVGIVIETLSEEEADERGIDGGVLVRRVIEGGPSDGLLMNDDVITVVDGEDVSDARELIEIVQASEPEDVLTFTVMRDGASMDVDVTVGVREVRIMKRNFDFASPVIPKELMELAEGGFESFVRAEVVVEAEDGTFKTIRAVKGTVEEGSVDEDAGTFTLNPKDGSESIDYQINDDTRVFINHTGGIEGLNSEEKTIVVDVIDENGESTVMIVAQGALLDMIDKFQGFGGPGMRSHGFGGAFGPGLRFDHPGEGRGPRIRRFDFIVPPGLEGLENREFEFEGRIPNLEDFFDNLPFDLDEFDIPDDSDIEDTTPSTNA